MTSPREPRHLIDLDVQPGHNLTSEQKHAAALQVASRFAEQPAVALELLDMLGLLAPPQASLLAPDPVPDAMGAVPRGWWSGNEFDARLRSPGEP